MCSKEQKEEQKLLRSGGEGEKRLFAREIEGIEEKETGEAGLSECDVIEMSFALGVQRSLGMLAK